MQSRYLATVRHKNPLVHNITNIVAANFAANGVLAIGGSPFMSAAIEEMAEVPTLSSALVINIGTLMGKDAESMLLAGKTANQVGIPVVLDPVGVGATTHRRETVARLLAEVRFDLIRGNAGEIATLGEVEWYAKGVDAGNGSVDMAELARLVAKKYHCVVAISGEQDYISDGKTVAKISNGTPLFPRITASGCLLGAVCGAFLAVAERADYFAATVEACTAYAVAGELAAKQIEPHQTGSFAVGLIDQLSGLTPALINQNARVEYV